MERMYETALPALQLNVIVLALKINPGTGVNICAGSGTGVGVGGTVGVTVGVGRGVGVGFGGFFLCLAWTPRGAHKRQSAKANPIVLFIWGS